jgi:predicted Zn-dependent protease
MNKSPLWRLATIFILVTALVLLPVGPARAFLDDILGSMTIEKERQVGEEFLLQLQQEIPLVEDPFVTSYLNRLGQKLVTQMGPQPFKYRFFIVDDPSMNAFAVPGGYVFVTTGMIRQTSREGELAGVLAHEISHIYARHMAKTMEKAKFTTIASLIGAMAGVFLGGVGGAALSQAVVLGSAAGGASAMLKYSRDFEKEADSLGFKWMLKAGYNPRDMISIFRKLGKQRWFEGGEIPIYLSTHPDVDSRLVDLSHQLSLHQDEIQQSPNSPDYQYFAVRVEAISGNPHQLYRRMAQDGARDPQNAVYPYGRALALSRLERYDESAAAFQQALKLAPDSYVIKRDLAIPYFTRNRYPEAQGLLEELSRRNPQDDVVLYYLGRIYQERRQFDQALPLFEKVYNLNPTFSEIYYNLGTLYGEKGQLGLAHYYLGLHSLKVKALPTALFHFRKAAQNLSPADSRYLEAQRQVTRLERMRVRVVN